MDRYQRQHLWLAFPVAVMRKFGDDAAGNLAALVAYYAFFSIFPLLLVLVTALAFAVEGNEALGDRVLQTALSEIPVVGTQIGRGIDPMQGSGMALAVGIAGALWGGLGVMQAGQNAMNEVWNVPRQRRPDFLRTRLRSLGLLALLGAGVVASSALASLGLVIEGSGPLGAALSVVLNVGLFLLVFRLLTALPLPWSALWPGAVVASISWAALQSLGALYVNRIVARADDIYGVFATVIGLLSWLHLAAQALLFAAEVNVVRWRHLWPRGLLPDDLTPADQESMEGLAKEQKLHPIQRIDVTFDDAPDPGREDR